MYLNTITKMSLKYIDVNSKCYIWLFFIFYIFIFILLKMRSVKFNAKM